MPIPTMRATPADEAVPGRYTLTATTAAPSSRAARPRSTALASNHCRALAGSRGAAALCAASGTVNSASVSRATARICSSSAEASPGWSAPERTSMGSTTTTLAAQSSARSITAWRAAQAAG